MHDTFDKNVKSQSGTHLFKNSRKTGPSREAASARRDSRSWNELKRDETRVLARVTSATPGRILKGRNRNVHESISAAVRRRTRHWLPRRAFPGIKTGRRSPGQKPTTRQCRADSGSGRRGTFDRGARREIIFAREIWKIVTRNRVFRTRDPPSCTARRLHNESVFLEKSRASRFHTKDYIGVVSSCTC